MIRVVRLHAVLGLLAAALALTAIWLAFDNPDIDGTSRGDDYTCLAPWDTVLNDADNMPGGEPPPDAEETGARCRQAGQTRLTVAGVSGSAAVALAGLTAALVWRRSRDRVPSSL
jgi:MYXO-CTERM domain-containing protein